MADTCATLSAEIAALKAEVAKLNRPGGDINALVGVAVGAAISQKLPTAVNSAVDSRLSGFTPSKYATIDDLKMQGSQIRGEVEGFRRNIEAGIATKAEKTAVEAYDAAMRGEIKRVEQTANTSQTTATKARDIANQAESKAVKAIEQAGEAISSSTKAAKDALNAANEVTGLKGVVEGVKGKVSSLGENIVKVEKAVGEAIQKAANAVGISNEALAATGRLAGRILEIFNTIAIIFTLIEQFAVLNTLGSRIDALERYVDSLSQQVGDVLTRISGLVPRINRLEQRLPQIEDVAREAVLIGNDAKSIGIKADSVANLAYGNASTAQSTADGAVRNASRANDNATTAYQKASQAEQAANSASIKAATAQTTATSAIAKANQATEAANAASRKADEATKQANKANNRAGEAFGKAVEALGVALTALSLYQGLKALGGLRGLPGIQGIPGIRGLPGIQGIPGRNGVTTVVQIPGTPGAPGRNGINGINGAPGRNGINGINGAPGRNGINGINGRNGVDAVPYNDAELKAFIAAQHAGTQNVTKVHTTALHVQMAAYLASQFAGVAVFLTNLTKALSGLINWALIDRFLNLMILTATIHNALMLSKNLGQSLISMIDNVLRIFGINNAKGESFSIADIVGTTVTNFIKTIVGEENYTVLSIELKKANRIYQASANVLNSVQSIGYSILSSLEVVGSWVASIGNALRKFGEVSEKAYRWMNPTPNFQNRFFTTLETTENVVSQIDQVASEVLSIKETVTQFGQQKEELDKALGEKEESKQGTIPPEATKIKAEIDASKLVSATGIAISDNDKEADE